MPPVRPDAQSKPKSKRSRKARNKKVPDRFDQGMRDMVEQGVWGQRLCPEGVEASPNTRPICGTLDLTNMEAEVADYTGSPPFSSVSQSRATSRSTSAWSSRSSSPNTTMMTGPQVPALHDVANMGGNPSLVPPYCHAPYSSNPLPYPITTSNQFPGRSSASTGFPPHENMGAQSSLVDSWDSHLILSNLQLQMPNGAHPSRPNSSSASDSTHYSLGHSGDYYVSPPPPSPSGFTYSSNNSANHTPPPLSYPFNFQSQPTQYQYTNNSHPDESEWSPTSLNTASSSSDSECWSFTTGHTNIQNAQDTISRVAVTDPVEFAIMYFNCNTASGSANHTQF